MLQRTIQYYNVIIMIIINSNKLYELWGQMELIRWWCRVFKVIIKGPDIHGELTEAVWIIWLIRPLLRTVWVWTDWLTTPGLSCQLCFTFIIVIRTTQCLVTAHNFQHNRSLISQNKMWKQLRGCVAPLSFRKQQNVLVYFTWFKMCCCSTCSPHYNSYCIYENYLSVSTNSVTANWYAGGHEDESGLTDGIYLTWFTANMAALTFSSLSSFKHWEINDNVLYRLYICVLYIDDWVK